MTSTFKNVIVAGATGNIGPAVIQSILSCDFKVSILTRDSSKTFPPSVTAIQTDYSETSLLQALKGQDVVVSTIGAIGTLSQLKLIDAAITAGVKRFIPSDFAPNTPELSEIGKVLPDLYARIKPKQTVLAYLEEKAKTHPEFSWSAVGSGPVFDWTLKLGVLGMSLKTRTAIITDSGNEPYMTTTIAQIARAIASILSQPEETANKYLMITSWITTQNKIVEALELATKSEWEIKHVTSEERRNEGVELLKGGNSAGLGRLWNVWCNTDGEGHVFEEGKLANGMLGLPKEDLLSCVQEIVDEAAV